MSAWGEHPYHIVPSNSQPLPVSTSAPRSSLTQHDQHINTAFPTSSLSTSHQPHHELGNQLYQYHHQYLTNSHANANTNVYTKLYVNNNNNNNNSSSSSSSGGNSNNIVCNNYYSNNSNKWYNNPNESKYKNSRETKQATQPFGAETLPYTADPTIQSTSDEVVEKESTLESYHNEPQETSHDNNNNNNNDNDNTSNNNSTKWNELLNNYNNNNSSSSNNQAINDGSTYSPQCVEQVQEQEEEEWEQEYQSTQHAMRQGYVQSKEEVDLRPVRSPLSRPPAALSANIMAVYKSINLKFCNERRRQMPHGSHGKHIRNNGYDDEEGHYIPIIGEEIASRYTVQEVIGKGSFGIVLKCCDEKYQEGVAMKIVRSGAYFESQGMLEAEIVAYLNRNPALQNRVVQLRKAFIWQFHIVLVFELLSFNLFQLIRCTKYNGVSLDLTRKFAYQLLQVLLQLEAHRPPIIHCDLKPENVVLRDPSRSGIRLIDFGSACYQQMREWEPPPEPSLPEPELASEASSLLAFLHANSQQACLSCHAASSSASHNATQGHYYHTHNMAKYIQSRFYRAPEVILELGYTTAIDRWSLGCMLVELHTGVPLFPGKNEAEMLARFTAICGPLPQFMLSCSPKVDRFYHKVPLGSITALTTTTTTTKTTTTTTSPSCTLAMETSKQTTTRTTTPASFTTPILPETNRSTVSTTATATTTTTTINTNTIILPSSIPEMDNTEHRETLTNSENVNDNNENKKENDRGKHNECTLLNNNNDNNTCSEVELSKENNESHSSSVNNPFREGVMSNITHINHPSSHDLANAEHSNTNAINKEIINNNKEEYSNNTYYSNHEQNEQQTERNYFSHEANMLHECGAEININSSVNNNCSSNGTKYMYTLKNEPDAIICNSLTDIIGVYNGGPRGCRRGQYGHDVESYLIFKDFVSNLLQYDPRLRMDCATALRHPFFLPILEIEAREANGLQGRHQGNT